MASRLLHSSNLKDVVCYGDTQLWFGAVYLMLSSLIDGLISIKSRQLVFFAWEVLSSPPQHRDFQVLEPFIPVWNHYVGNLKRMSIVRQMLQVRGIPAQPSKTNAQQDMN